MGGGLAGLKPPLVLTSADITNSIVGTVTNGSTLVSYSTNLQAQAALVAGSFELSLADAARVLSMPLSPPHIYLLRLPREQRAIQFSMSIPAGEHALPWLIVLTNDPPQTIATSASPVPVPTTASEFLTARAADEELLWADLRQLPVHIFIFAHEAFELRLINPGELLVMGDIVAQRGFLKFTFEHHTRWFRDGLANFCALKARDSFRRQRLAAGTTPGLLRFESSMQPFSELARVNDKLFAWDQDSPADYYDAATALFLLIELRAGPQAISSIVQELPNIKFPDRNALLKMILRKTGLDLRYIARTFEFPDLGLDATPRLEIETVLPDTWVARAGLLPGDLLLEANSRPITSLLDVELAILHALDFRQPVSFTFLREGTRHTTLSLPLPSK